MVKSKKVKLCKQWHALHPVCPVFAVSKFSNFIDALKSLPNTLTLIEQAVNAKFLR